MALRASEILLILRAKNQASMTIRRVAKDVQFLGRTVKANQAGFDMMQRGRGHAVGGAAMTHVGGAASLIGAGTLAGLGAASKSFADFDKMSTQAATQIGNINNSVEDVTANSERLRKAILAQMAQFPSTASEMSDAAYDIFSSMDVGFNKGIGLLKLFNQAAVAGMTDVATAGNGAITVLNNFDPALEHPKKTLNEMFSIIRFGRIDLATLNTMMNQIAPAAAAADQSLGDISGAIATLTRRLGPSVASAGLARLLRFSSVKTFRLVWLKPELLSLMHKVSFSRLKKSSSVSWLLVLDLVRHYRTSFRVLPLSALARVESRLPFRLVEPLSL